MIDQGRISNALTCCLTVQAPAGELADQRVLQLNPPSRDLHTIVPGFPFLRNRANQKIQLPYNYLEKMSLYSEF